MKSRAAVAFGPGQPLQIVELDVAPPKRGEERVLRILITPIACQLALEGRGRKETRVLM